jgi:hypothetical protein
VNKLRREVVDQLQRRERQRRGAVTLWLWQPIDDALVVKPLQALERERWASTIAQQSLQAGAILRAHAHLGIQREAAVLSGAHVADVITLDQAAAGEPLLPPPAYLFGDGSDGLGGQLGRGAKAHGLRVITGLLDRLEDPVDDAAMVVNRRLREAPKRWMKLTALRRARAPAPLPWIKCASMTRSRIRRTALRARGSRSRYQRSRLGTERTHWRTGSGGMT